MQESPAPDNQQDDHPANLASSQNIDLNRLLLVMPSHPSGGASVDAAAVNDAILALERDMQTSDQVKNASMQAMLVRQGHSCDVAKSGD